MWLYPRPGRTRRNPDGLAIHKPSRLCRDTGDGPLSPGDIFKRPRSERLREFLGSRTIYPRKRATRTLRHLHVRSQYGFAAPVLDERTALIRS